MPDYIDNAQDHTVRLTDDALRRATQAAHEAHYQTLIWVDDTRDAQMHVFIGTYKDRLEYMDTHGIGKLPFAFMYTAEGRQFVGGNNANLRGILEQRAQLA